MLKYLFTLLFVFTLCRADLLFPEKGQELNYIHVLFDWDQEPNAILYNLQISNLESFNNIILDVHEETTLYIVKDTIEWESTYYWRIRPIYNNGNIGQWSEESYFTTGEPKTSGQDVDIYSNDLIQDGVIVYGWATGAIDRFGNEIWNTEYFLMNQINNYGQLYGQMGVEQGGELTHGGELNFYNQFLWMSPEGTEVDRHEIIQLPNGNYMAFTYVYQLGPVPLGDWTQNYQSLGYTADGVTDEFQWRGCKIIEWDQETREEVWSWDPFDHFSMDDHDLYGGTWWNATNSWSYDWMHSNGLHFDEDESVIYVSHRNLSRISKISYPSGEVIWNLGLPAEYNTGDENICTDLLFSFQHHIQLMDDETLLFFDNGNISNILTDDETPITRIRRIRVIDDSYCETLWQYDLSPNLHGAGMGSVQLLENGNYSIYTYGSGLGDGECSIFEITQEQEMVWKVTSQNQNSAWYRSYKIPSLHPDAFSIIANEYILNENNAVVIELSNNSLNFKLYNKSGYSQIYNYILADNNGMFNNDDGTITIEPYMDVDIEFPVQNSNILESNINFSIWPAYHEYSIKELSFIVNNNTLLGDINNDGLVNVIDIVLVVNIVLDETETPEADLNNDGLVNILDIVLLVNLILT